MELSVVIPVLNEEKNIPQLHQALINTLTALEKSFEIIYVDDGSTDSSFQLLSELYQKSPEQIRVIQFRRRFGQTAAMSAGIAYAQGKIIIMLDADLQNDPVDIPRLLEKMEEGYDIVSGWRINRKDKYVTRILPSKIANWLIGSITGVKLHDYGCSLKAYRAEVIKELKLYGEMHRFIPALASWVGAKIAEIPVQHHPRRFGKSKYTLNRIWRVLLDLITVKFLLSFSTRPLQIFGSIGLISCILGLGISGYLTFLKLAYQEHLSNRPLLWLGILLIMLGFQFISLGLLAELVARTYHESQNKPIYVIRQMLK
ncbi:MAG: glycosyltransferase family 2 protein [bacterium]|nr:glycosyltransferase family 2 protein [bacterium]